MGKREDTLRALGNGQTPGQIADSFGVTLDTTLGYLNQLVGEGKLRRSDILFSIPGEVRKAVAERSGECPPGIDYNDYRVVREYSNDNHVLADMYDDLREIEVRLHLFLKLYLQSCLGPSEDGWWRKGVPEKTRQTCQLRREEDDWPACEPYGYTDLLDLGKVLEHNWRIVEAWLPKTYRSNRKQMLEDLRRLNNIRKIVMHPVRGSTPSEEDFDFVRDLKKTMYPAISEALNALISAKHQCDS